MSSMHLSKTGNMSVVNKDNGVSTDTGLSALDTSSLGVFRDMDKIARAIPGIEIPKPGIPGIEIPKDGIPGIEVPKPGGGGSYGPNNGFSKFIDSVSWGLKSDPTQMIKTISEQLTKSEMRDAIKGLRDVIKAQPEGTDVTHLRDGIRGIRELLRTE